MPSMGKQERERADALLRDIAEQLAEAMVACKGRSAMVRTYNDEEGRVMVAANMYAYGTSLTPPRPVVEWKEEA